MEESPLKLVVGKTPAGKELQIVRNPTTNMFHLQYSTGGEVPRELRDPWNNLEMLRVKATRYLEELEDAKSSDNEAV